MTAPRWLPKAYTQAYKHSQTQYERPLQFGQERNLARLARRGRQIESAARRPPHPSLGNCEIGALRLGNSAQGQVLMQFRHCFWQRGMQRGPCDCAPPKK